MDITARYPRKLPWSADIRAISNSLGNRGCPQTTSDFYGRRARVYGARPRTNCSRGMGDLRACAT